MLTLSSPRAGGTYPNGHHDHSQPAAFFIIGVLHLGLLRILEDRTRSRKKARDWERKSWNTIISLAIKSIFIENMALAFFLGMCYLSWLALRSVATAIGLGAAVIFVLTYYGTR